MKLHQVLTGATNTFDDKAAIDVGSVEDHPFTVKCKLNNSILVICKLTFDQTVCTQITADVKRMNNTTADK